MMDPIIAKGLEVMFGTLNKELDISVERTVDMMTRMYAAMKRKDPECLALAIAEKRWAQEFKAERAKVKRLTAAMRELKQAHNIRVRVPAKYERSWTPMQNQTEINSVRMEGVT